MDCAVECIPQLKFLGSAQERGFDLGKQFKGEVTMAGKDRDKDCSVGTQDLTGKVPYLLFQPTAAV